VSLAGDGAGTSNSGTVAVTNDVGLHHVIGTHSLAGSLGTNELVLWAAVEVSAETALGIAISGTDGDGGVVSGVTDEYAQRLRIDEDVVIVMLEDLEDLGVSFVAVDLLGQRNRLSVNDGGVDVMEFNLVFTHQDGNIELISGGLAAEDNISWLFGTISTDQSGALGHIGVVSEVVESLNCSRCNITIAVYS